MCKRSYMVSPSYRRAATAWVVRSSTMTIR